MICHPHVEACAWRKLKVTLAKPRAPREAPIRYAPLPSSHKLQMSRLALPWAAHRPRINGRRVARKPPRPVSRGARCAASLAPANVVGAVRLSIAKLRGEPLREPRRFHDPP